jgi:hypothetical protein
MAHTLLYLLGYNKLEDALLPADWDWSSPDVFDAAYQKLTEALRPWTIDFHVAQNDATVLGSGTHEKTGHHCLATDPNGKLDIVRHAGFWMRDAAGRATKAFRTICWDGCMFPNAVMMQQQTWNDILAAMVAVRDAHGWQEAETAAPQGTTVAEVFGKAVRRATRAPAKKVTPRKVKKAAARPAARKPVKKTRTKAPPLARKMSVNKQKRKAMKTKKAVKKVAKKATKKPAKKSKK